MTKRDTIQRCLMVTTKDSMGGTTETKELKEIVTAHVSQNTTYGEMTQYGVKEQVVLNVVTDHQLDTNTNVRYIFSGKSFKVMRQVKSGNEYFSVLMEVN